MIHEILTGADNAILRTPSAVVTSFDKKLKELIADLLDTVHARDDGAGLAAPQIGINLRVVVVGLPVNEKDLRLLPMVNPVITERSVEMVAAEEGCLSIPGVFAPVARAKQITVEFADEDGKAQSLRLSDFGARVVQHECDHLDGVLFVDHIQKNRVIL
jgi:peptide deformylase